MSILNINDLAMQLVALDFSDGHMPNNGGPTKTSRALAIIHSAAYDAYAKVTKSKKLTRKFGKIPNPPATLDNLATTGSIALLSAGFRAATLLYPDFEEFIAAEAAKLSIPNDGAYKYGEQVAEAWIAMRMNDGSSAPQFDSLFDLAPGKHRPDPLDPKQQALGRNWGLVKPFVLSNVSKQAKLQAPPSLDGLDDASYVGTNYATAFNEVIKDGKNDLPTEDAIKARIGIFWGYDGSNKLGVPPRLYNQVVRAIDGFNNLSHEEQIQILTAINVAMADAGIAAWYWKYQYDVWRPVVGIREADPEWGPIGGGDGNDDTTGDPFWLPLGAPNSNPIKPAANGTPGFPAYPSGHATFGAACFKTVAGLLGTDLKDININFVSDEFNGKTTDNTGVVRPNYQEKISLLTAIKDNNESRIWLGVHWRFDAEGGETLGTAISTEIIKAFS